jgi:hypothetical protein
VIFSRNRGGTGRHQARRRERDEFGQAPVEREERDGGTGDDRRISVRPPRARDLSTGPYDSAEAPEGVERLDLGSLKIPVPPGVELRVQADPDGQIQQVILASDESFLQLGVFAAPRTEGIWDEVRDDIRKQLFDDGVAVEEDDGEFGTELRGRVRTPDGLTDIRFVGVDGPRWMVRAVYHGPAAVDDGAAVPLVAVLHGLVVERGAEAMPVREPLPLRLPREVAERAAEEQAAAQAEAEAGGGAATGGAPATQRRPSPRPRRG